MVDDKANQPRQRDPGATVGRGAQVQLNAVTKHFGDFTAVDGIDLTIEAGEFLTLLGPSGSGKTTILNMVAGFLELDGGHILVDGAPVDRQPPHKRDFGVVFQNYALFPRMSVFDNVAFPLRMRGMSKDECQRRVADVLELLRLPEQARKMPSQLSGGQQQRVAVARAIVFEPRVVLMDEPMSALDRKLREALQIELKELHRTIGTTVIYVTHDQSEALTMSDRIAVMRSGRIVQSGRPSEIYDRPANEFVATFVGEANRLSGRVDAVDDSLASVITTGSLVIDVAIDQESLRPGDEVELSIRPERVRVTPVTDPVPGAISGRVSSVIFVGNTTRYWITLEGGVVLQAWAQNTDDRPAWEEGADVLVVVSPASVRILAGAQTSVVHGPA